MITKNLLYGMCFPNNCNFRGGGGVVETIPYIIRWKLHAVTCILIKTESREVELKYR